MAPELFQDEGVHSFASDLWALGCVLYEMATGKPPFVSASLNELVGLILNSETPRVEKFSPEFNDLLAGLLEKVIIYKAKSYPFRILVRESHGRKLGLMSFGILMNSPL